MKMEKMEQYLRQMPLITVPDDLDNHVKAILTSGKPEKKRLVFPYRFVASGLAAVLVSVILFFVTRLDISPFRQTTVLPPVFIEIQQPDESFMACFRAKEALTDKQRLLLRGNREIIVYYPVTRQVENDEKVLMMHIVLDSLQIAR